MQVNAIRKRQDRAEKAPSVVCCVGPPLLSAAGSTWGQSQRGSGCWWMDVIFNAPQMTGRNVVILKITVTLLRWKLKEDKLQKDVQPKSKLNAGISFKRRCQIWNLQWHFSCRDIQHDSALLLLLFGSWRCSREKAEEHRVGIVTLRWFNDPSMHWQTHSTLSSICLKLWRFSQPQHCQIFL